jgi:hypothetical protein
MKTFAFLLVLLAVSAESWGASPWEGTWLMREQSKKFQLSMTIKEVPGGWKISWRVPTPDAKGAASYVTMTADSALDGKEMPNLIDGKPSGQTMAIRKLDDLSRDGKVITSENEFSATGPSGAEGKTVQHWDKQ